MSKIWAPKELEFLITHYPLSGIKYCCEYLGRSSASVRGKAFNLRLSAPGSKVFTHAQYEQQLLDREVDAYPIETYISHKTAIKHACILGHEWSAQPHNILNRHGCPICNYSGFRYDIPATLYYVHLRSISSGEAYYKIGITNKTPEARFKNETDKEVRIILEDKYLTGAEAEAAEKILLKKYRSTKTEKIKFLKYGGNTELFRTDVMGLDT